MAAVGHAGIDPDANAQLIFLGRLPDGHIRPHRPFSIILVNLIMTKQGQNIFADHILNMTIERLGGPFRQGGQAGHRFNVSGQIEIILARIVLSQTDADHADQADIIRHGRGSSGGRLGSGRHHLSVQDGLVQRNGLSRRINRQFVRQQPGA